MYQSLSHLFKCLPRAALVPHVNVVCAAVSDAASATASVASNMLVRKLKIKLLQRVALTYMPPCETSWRYQMGTLNSKLRYEFVKYLLKFATAFLRMKHICYGVIDCLPADC